MWGLSLEQKIRKKKEFREHGYHRKTIPGQEESQKALNGMQSGKTGSFYARRFCFCSG